MTPSLIPTIPPTLSPVDEILISSILCTSKIMPDSPLYAATPPAAPAQTTVMEFTDGY